MAVAPTPHEGKVWVDGDYPWPGQWFKRDDPRLKSWKCGHARRVDAGKGWWYDCPACAVLKKHRRNYIAGHIAILLIQILLGCLWAAEAVR
jgi:hypothetical protein